MGEAAVDIMKDKKDDITVMDDADFELAFDAVAEGKEIPPAEESEEEKATRLAAEQAQADADAKAQADADAQAQAEADAKKSSEELAAEQKAADDAQAQADADAKAKADADAKAQADADARAKADADAKAQADADAKAKADADAKALAEKNEAALKPTEEEEKALKVLKEEWKDIDAATSAKERILVEKLSQTFTEKLTEAITAIRAEFGERVQPVLDTVATTAKASFETTVKDAHADAYELLPEIETWIGTQPAFLQPGYNHVLDHGTAAETITLLTTFKEATGKVESTDDATAAAAKAAADAKAAAEAEKAKKLASQEGVNNRRSAKTDGVDADDFEGAFNEAASQ